MCRSTCVTIFSRRPPATSSALLRSATTFPKVPARWRTAHVKETFARELTADKLGARMAALSRAEHNFVARAIPLVIKDFILWSADAISESYMAGSISNIGKIDLPEAAKPFVKRFDVFVSTEKLQACICSYGSELTVSFTSAFFSTNVQKNFFRQLTQAGIPVEIQSNKLEADLR